MNKSYQNFKKRVGKLAVTFALVGTTAAGGMAVATDSVDAATVKSGYTSTTVTLRKSASTKSAKLTTIKKGAKVTILKTSGKWLKVKYNGKTGYVYKTYVKKTFTTKDYSGKFKLKTDLNVRKGPGTSFVKAGTLKKGTVVTVKGKTSNGWYTITYKGSTRYISASSKYLTKYVAPTPKPEKNNAPTISVNDTYTLVKGENFEFSMLKATASDKEDGDLTSKIDFSGVVDTGKVGDYTVKLTVKDSKGATATKTVKVVVEDVKTNTNPVIAVDSELYITQGNEFDYSMLKATAYDEEDGSLTHKIVYSGDTVDTKVAGTYKVTLSVTDSNNNTVEKTVKVIVSRNSVPTIKTSLAGNTLTITKGGRYDESMLKLTAYDKEDGDLTSKIQISGDKVDTTRLGTYNVVATVTDSKGIPERLTITVNVVENMEPQITMGNTTMVIEQGDAINRQSILEALKVKAINPEDNSDITNKVDIYGLGSVNVNTPGDYTIKLSVEDEIGGVTGSALEQATIKVVANQKPVINVQSKFIIMQGSNFKPSADIKATATDTNLATGEVRDISSSIKYEGAEYVNTNVPGPYTITVKATDNKGLVTTERIVVVVKAYSEPTITINNKDVVNGVLTVKSGTTVNEDTFAAVAKDYRGDSLDITYDGLDKVNTKRVGMYPVTLTARDEFGRPATVTIYVNVVE